MVEFLNVPSRRQPKVAPGTTVTLFPPTQSGAVGRIPTRLAGWTADGETFLRAAPGACQQLLPLVGISPGKGTEMEKTLSVWRSGSHDRERPAVTWTSSAPGQRGDTA